MVDKSTTDQRHNGEAKNGDNDGGSEEGTLADPLP